MKGEGKKRPERKRKSKTRDKDRQTEVEEKILIWKFRMVAAVLAAIMPSFFPVEPSFAVSRTIYMSWNDSGAKYQNKNKPRQQ